MHGYSSGKLSSVSASVKCKTDAFDVYDGCVLHVQVFCATRCWIHPLRELQFRSSQARTDHLSGTDGSYSRNDASSDFLR